MAKLDSIKINYIIRTMDPKKKKRVQDIVVEMEMCLGVESNNNCMPVLQDWTSISSTKARLGQKRRFQNHIQTVAKYFRDYRTEAWQD